MPPLRSPRRCNEVAITINDQTTEMRFHGNNWVVSDGDILHETGTRLNAVVRLDESRKQIQWTDAMIRDAF